MLIKLAKGFVNLRVMALGRGKPLPVRSARRPPTAACETEAVRRKGRCCPAPYHIPAPYYSVESLVVVRKDHVLLT